MGLQSETGIRIGSGTPGPRNLITDVPGVTVGHVTIQDGTVNTGVTAVLPHQGNLFRDKVMAASAVINGFGKTMGLVQVEELGTIETPIVLTNTLSIGTAATALIRYMLRDNPDIGTTTGTVNPLVCECNDSRINDIRGLHITEDHVLDALTHTGEEFAEGAVGAGTGMCCLGFKGGIGSASRLVTLDGVTYTIGALVLSNFGGAGDLRLNGTPIAPPPAEKPDDKTDKGSIIMLLATDLPLSERQLKRLCRRAGVGLARTGSCYGNGSGDIAIAFTTANRIPHYAETAVLETRMLADSKIDAAFRMTADAVEEAILSSLFHAVPTKARDGSIRPSLADSLPKSNM